MAGLPECSLRIPAESSVVPAWLKRARGTQSVNDSPFPMHLSPVLAGVKGSSRPRPVRRHPSTPSNLSLLSTLFTSTSLQQFRRDAGVSTMLADGNWPVNAKARTEPAPGGPRRPVAKVATNPGSPRWFPRRLMQCAEGPVPLTPTEELRCRNRCTIGETGDFAGILERLVCRSYVAGGGVRDVRIAAFCVAHGAEALFTRDRKSSRLPEPCAPDHFEAVRHPSQ